MRNRYLSSLALAAALAVPALVAPAPSLNAQAVQLRYYDRDHRDYHVWDDREDRAHRAYLEEQHRKYIEYQRMKRAEQRRYWQWRHNHPDQR